MSHYDAIEELERLKQRAEEQRQYLALLERLPRLMIPVVWFDWNRTRASLRVAQLGRGYLVGQVIDGRISYGPDHP